MINEKIEIALSNQALKYFEKRLLLSEDFDELDPIDDLESDNSTESANSSETQDIDSNGHVEDESSYASDAILAIEDAKTILGNFPIDKSRFSPEREYIIQGSIFDKQVKADKILNSLLFATKLAFFDVSDSENTIIKEVSEDSFGYMNILRHNQIKILDSEVIKLKNKLNYLNNDNFLSNIALLKDYKEQDSEDVSAYLEELISFYALNVMNKNDSSNLSLINTWLDNKIGDIYE